MAQMNLKQRQTQSNENRLVVAKGEEGGKGTDWSLGVSRCKLLYLGWINHKALL